MQHLLLLLALSVLLSAPARADSIRLDRVRAAKELRVCIWPDYYGITYRSPHTGLLTGLDVDMARALAQDLGLELRFVNTSFATLIDDVTQDRCDVAMSGVGITPSRAGKLRFTRSYLVSDMHAITTRSDRRIQAWPAIDKPGVVVAVLRGTLHEPVLRDKLKAATMMVVDSPRAREQEVESGRADVFMSDLPYSRRMLDTVDWARVVSPTAPYHVTPYAYAVRPGDDAWFARLEQFVAAIKRDGRLLTSARSRKLDMIVELR